MVSDKAIHEAFRSRKTLETKPIRETFYVQLKAVPNFDLENNLRTKLKNKFQNTILQTR